MLLVRVAGAMYSGIQDCDEGTSCSFSSVPTPVLINLRSLQLLGAATLSVEGLRVPDMGDFPRVLDPELGVHPPPVPPGQHFRDLHRSRKGESSITADASCPDWPPLPRTAETCAFRSAHLPRGRLLLV